MPDGHRRHANESLHGRDLQAAKTPPNRALTPEHCLIIGGLFYFDSLVLPNFVPFLFFCFFFLASVASFFWPFVFLTGLASDGFPDERLGASLGRSKSAHANDNVKMMIDPIASIIVLMDVFMVKSVSGYGLSWINPQAGNHQFEFMLGPVSKPV